MASYVHYCLHKLKLLPSEFFSLPVRERAFIVGSIQEVMRARKEEEAALKRKMK